MKKRKSRLIAIALGAAGMIVLGLAAPSAQLCAAEPQSFAEDIMPIFKGRCAGCHPPGQEGYEKERARPHQLRGRDEGHQARQDGHPRIPTAAT